MNSLFATVAPALDPEATPDNQIEAFLENPHVVKETSAFHARKVVRTSGKSMLSPEAVKHTVEFVSSATQQLFSLDLSFYVDDPRKAKELTSAITSARRRCASLFLPEAYDSDHSAVLPLSDLRRYYDRLRGTSNPASETVLFYALVSLGFSFAPVADSRKGVPTTIQPWVVVGLTAEASELMRPSNEKFRLEIGDETSLTALMLTLSIAKASINTSKRTLRDFDADCFEFKATSTRTFNYDDVVCVPNPSKKRKRKHDQKAMRKAEGKTNVPGQISVPGQVSISALVCAIDKQTDNDDLADYEESGPGPMVMDTNQD